MKRIAILLLVITVLIVIGVQAQTLNISEKQLVGTFDFAQTNIVESENVPMVVMLSGTLSINANHTCEREGKVEIVISIDQDDLSNMYCMTFTFKSTDEIWKLKGDSLSIDIKAIDVKFVSMQTEKDDDPMLAKIKSRWESQGPNMAEDLQLGFLGNSTKKIVGIDTDYFSLLENDGEETFYMRSQSMNDLVEGDVLRCDSKDVEFVPSYPDGDAALLEDIAKNLKYPTEAQDGVERRVVLQFVVTKDGAIGEVKVVRTAGTEFDEAAVQAVKQLKRFNPGRLLNKKPVDMWFTVPVRFN